MVSKVYRCVYCRSRCSEPSPGTEAVCRRCRSIIATSPYVAQWDPAFLDRVIEALLFPPSGKAGDWVALHRQIGCRHEDLKGPLRLLRRHGWHIEGARGQGYRVTGYSRNMSPSIDEQPI